MDKPVRAGSDTPPRVKGPAQAALSAAESFAGSRQLAAATGEPPSDLLRYARMVKPFPTRRLAEILYYVEADAGLIHRLTVNAQVEPPTQPDLWRETLDHILEVLASLTERIEQATPLLNTLWDQADADYERSITALTAIMRAIADGQA
jgi:hypothetical protein